MDYILYNVLIGFVCFFIGYLFGSIPNGVLIGKIFFKRDPRLEGSKNSGGTNVGRLFGKKIGFLVIVLDMLKSIIPTIGILLILKYSGLENTLVNNFGEGYFDNGILFSYLTPLGVSIGHCWPLFIKFKGGKTVAVFAGFCAITSWALIVVCIIAFFVTLKIKKYVSLASIVTACAVVIFSWTLFGFNFIIPEQYRNITMWGNGDLFINGYEFASALTLVAIILVYRHKANIDRLIKHEENKIKWMK